MEWYEVLFKGLSLVVIWAIPAILVLAVVAFTILTPALTLAGVVSRLYEVICDKLRRRARAETQDLNLVCAVDAECPLGFTCVDGYCMPEKELVGKKS